MNTYGISAAVEQEARDRDTDCVYCRRPFAGKIKPTIEHIINDINLKTIDNIAICCNGCNSSKRRKTLTEWFKSDWCATYGIRPDSVAEVIQKAWKAAQSPE